MFETCSFYDITTWFLGGLIIVSEAMPFINKVFGVDVKKYNGILQSSIKVLASVRNIDYTSNDASNESSNESSSIEII